MVRETEEKEDGKIRHIVNRRRGDLEYIVFPHYRLEMRRLILKRILTTQPLSVPEGIRSAEPALRSIKEEPLRRPSLRVWNAPLASKDEDVTLNFKAFLGSRLCPIVCRVR